MASIINSFATLNLHKRLHFSKYPIRCSTNQDLNTKVNGKSYVLKDESIRDSLDLGNGSIGSSVVQQKFEKLEPLWDDGYGTESVKDYKDYVKDLIKPDGLGPPRWFTPLSCGNHLKDSPVLLSLPGINGVGLDLILHHKALGKVFDVWCMHIPVQDRTPFEDLVAFVEETVRAEHFSSPRKPIYIVGNSFGGCLALAVAARNPKIDLVLILVNPASSFGRSQLQPFLPLLEALPNYSVPYLLSFVTGDLMKMATRDINTILSPTQIVEQLSTNLTALVSRFSVLTNIMPKETQLWKLKLLKNAAAYANSRLHAITAEVLVLSSGKDNLLPSKDEGLRLLSSIRNCKLRHFKDNGHTLLLEDGVNLLSIIKGTYTYRRSRKHDYVKDFLPPSAYEFEKFLEKYEWYRNYVGPVMLSTKEDGKIVRGLSGVPNEGPVLLVGYHMLMGLELAPLVQEFLLEKKIMIHGIAHPVFFSTESQYEESPFGDDLRIFGAIPVSPTNLFKLLATKSHVLLYPGGTREALHHKGEEYKLFWPDEPEFIRMAARFGATIVPFGVIGEDDIVELVLDYDDLMIIPFLNDRIKRESERFNVRAGMSGEVGNQPLYFPGVMPKVPGRLYYLFGKPIETKGREEMLKDKEKARELYKQIKVEVESNMSYLLKKRTEDPFRGLVDRTIYRAFRAPMDQVPSFEP